MRGLPFYFRRIFPAAALLGCAVILIAAASAGSPQTSDQFWNQTQEQADAKSTGCISCHTSTDSATMHPTGTVRLGCTDCHGGSPQTSIQPGVTPSSPQYEKTKR